MTITPTEKLHKIMRAIDEIKDELKEMKQKTLEFDEAETTLEKINSKLKELDSRFKGCTKFLSGLSGKRHLIKMMKSRFQVYKDVAEKFRFRLRASNNKIVAVSEAYETKDGCLNGVHAIKKYCDVDIEDLTTGEEGIANPKFQVYRDKADKFRFRLRAPNNEIVAVGEGYESKAGCMKGVQAVKEYCNAEIEDLAAGGILEEPSSKVPEEVVIGGGETTLTLDKPPSEVQKGSTVSFTGKLISENKGVAGAYIAIYESDRSFMEDDYLGSGETLEDGTFSIGWDAKEMDWWDDTVEVYAVFRGAGVFEPSKSEKHIIKVS